MFVTALLFLVVFLVSVTARRTSDALLKSAAKVGSPGALTGADVVRRIARAMNLSQVKVTDREGYWSDFYHLRKKEVFLSDRHFSGASMRGFAVGLHEAGHALQDHFQYPLLRWRQFVLRLNQVGFGAMVVFGLIAVPLMGVPFAGVMRGVIFAWVVLLILNVLTISAEFDASRRAMQVADKIGLLKFVEHRGECSKALFALALRDLATFLSSPRDFVYALMPLSKRGG